VHIVSHRRRGRGFRRHLAGGPGAPLGGQHRPEIAPGGDHREHQRQRQQRVEAVGNRIQEHQVGVEVELGQRGQRIAHQPDLVADPGRDQRDAGHRRGGGIDQVGELLARDPGLVGDRTHRVADHQRVGVVIEKDGQSENRGRGHRATRIVGEGRDPLDDAEHAAVARDHADGAADQQRKHHHCGVIGLGHSVQDVGIGAARQCAQHAGR